MRFIYFISWEKAQVLIARLLQAKSLCARRSTITTLEDFKRRADFRELVYLNLAKTLDGYGYVLTYDNREDEGTRKWIFKLVFKGLKTIEICNDDWRDYTEYFRIKINGQEIKILNVDKYNDIETAYDDLESTIIKLVDV